MVHALESETGKSQGTCQYLSETYPGNRDIEGKQCGLGSRLRKLLSFVTLCLYVWIEFCKNAEVHMHIREKSRFT